MAVGNCFQQSRWIHSFPYKARFSTFFCDLAHGKDLENNGVIGFIREAMRKIYGKNIFVFFQCCWSSALCNSPGIALCLIFCCYSSNYTRILHTHTTISAYEYGTLQSLNWYIIRHFQFHSLLLFSAGLHFTCILIGKLWFSFRELCGDGVVVVSSIQFQSMWMTTKRENVKKTYHSWKHTPSTLIFNE